MEQFIDRHQAGQLLAKRLKAFIREPNLLVLALPRGGVPIGFEIANALSIPLDVFIVRKLGVPDHKEYAMGAIATGEIILLNNSCYARSILSCHIFKLLPSNLVRSKNQFVLNSKVI
ncbi:hypothetical protein [Legionella sp. km772]|uniref:hypothetical protein n=1 Tax=Legionella sp. km772 TaxID=2498111 RepID=UPI000F8C8D9F|nr:hypothetical protein [Legionella sp. km772]RUR05779.1 hypothetical protein ELY15_13935 [Legionella sp. km772]